MKYKTCLNAGSVSPPLTTSASFLFMDGTCKAENGEPPSSLSRLKK